VLEGARGSDRAARYMNEVKPNRIESNPAYHGYDSGICHHLLPQIVVIQVANGEVHCGNQFVLVGKHGPGSEPTHMVYHCCGDSIVKTFVIGGGAKVWVRWQCHCHGPVVDGGDAKLQNVFHEGR
jgi:hypothetical protein